MRMKIKKPVSTYWEIELQGRYESEIENFHQQSGSTVAYLVLLLRLKSSRFNPTLVNRKCKLYLDKQHFIVCLFLPFL